jgi:hypothetical protein
VNGAEGLSARTDATHISRSGRANGKPRTSIASTTAKTAVVAPIVKATVTSTVSANAGRCA